jgi:hypothetical protein
MHQGKAAPDVEDANQAELIQGVVSRSRVPNLVHILTKDDGSFSIPRFCFVNPYPPNIAKRCRIVAVPQASRIQCLELEAARSGSQTSPGQRLKALRSPRVDTLRWPPLSFVPCEK